MGAGSPVPWVATRDAIHAAPGPPEPDAVAEAFYHAMSDPDPRTYYLVIPGAE